MGSLQDFIKVSELLTGLDDLNPALGDGYRRRLENTPGLGLDELVDTVRQTAAGTDPLTALSRQFSGDPKGQRLRRTAQQVVRIWYLSEYVDGSGVSSSAGAYLDSALYQVIEAHPQAFSDQPHGYWTKSPHRREEP